MSDLRELYQELIIDHGRHPRNFSVMQSATVLKEGFNPLCGDRLTLFLQIENNIVVNATFQGSGCAISMASASLMTEALKNKTVAEAKNIFELFHTMVTSDAHPDAAVLGKLMVLQGVCEFPSRVKCATLAWHTMIAAVMQDEGNVSTE